MKKENKLKVAKYKNNDILLDSEGTIFWKDFSFKDFTSIRYLRNFYEAITECLDEEGIKTLDIRDYNYKLTIYDVLDNHKNRKNIPAKEIWHIHFNNRIFEMKKKLLEKFYRRIKKVTK